jgi:hypothetical protein
MADMMSFQNSEILRSKLTAVMVKPPQVGYAWVTMEQAIEADMLFWSLMADEVIEGVKRNAGGRPCDQAFRTVFDSTEFRMAIATRQIPVAQPAQRPKVTQPPPTSEPTLSKRQRKLEAKRRATGELQPPPPVQPQPQPIKGKGKGKQGKAKSNLPKQLIGMCAVSNEATNSQRFCFGFNLGSCSAAAPGQACQKGLHACMKPQANGSACSMAHPCTGCTR